MELSEPGPQIGEAEIAGLEREFGAILPRAYRDFLMQHNGGRPSPDVVDIVGLPGTPTDVQVFFGIGRHIFPDDLFWNLRLIIDRNIGRRLLPIACDSGGDFFCLKAAEGGKFEVSYLDMSRSPAKLYDVAPSFEAFVDKLRSWS